MDYSYDPCMDLFTKGQAKRIDAARAFRHHAGKTTRSRTPTATAPSTAAAANTSTIGTAEVTTTAIGKAYIMGSELSVPIANV